ncbi:MAG: zinc-binding alcohol dehydrogenase [Gammaproteobacteria bacterium]
MSARQLWFTKPYNVEIQEHSLPLLQANEVLVRSKYSAISAGTEMLVYRGQIPADMPLDTSLAALQDRQAEYPLQYGYAVTGHIEQVGKNVDPAWAGKPVFAFQPHASHFITTLAQVIPLPEDIDPLAAVFLANMETAVNLVQDGHPLLGERVVVLGQGIVGLLVSTLLAEFPLDGLYALDRINERRLRANKAGVTNEYNPDSATEMHKLQKELSTGQSGKGADLIYELTGTPETLNLAIELCGYAGRIVIGSWYGTKPANLLLGNNFHRNRIQMISSQVSTIAPELSGRWDTSRRFDLAWKMIRKLHPEQLISHHIPFDCAADAYHLLDQSPEEVLQTVLTYEN